MTDSLNNAKAVCIEIWKWSNLCQPYQRNIKAAKSSRKGSQKSFYYIYFIQESYPGTKGNVTITNNTYARTSAQQLSVCLQTGTTLAKYPFWNSSCDPTHFWLQYLHISISLEIPLIYYETNIPIFNCILYTSIFTSRKISVVIYMVIKDISFCSLGCDISGFMVWAACPKATQPRLYQMRPFHLLPVLGRWLALLGSCCLSCRISASVASADNEPTVTPCFRSSF